MTLKVKNILVFIKLDPGGAGWAPGSLFYCSFSSGIVYAWKKFPIFHIIGFFERRGNPERAYL
jgi:hypothetical protein